MCPLIIGPICPTFAEDAHSRVDAHQSLKIHITLQRQEILMAIRYQKEGHVCVILFRQLNTRQNIENILQLMYE